MSNSQHSDRIDVLRRQLADHLADIVSEQYTPEEIDAMNFNTIDFKIKNVENPRQIF